VGKRERSRAFSAKGVQGVALFLGCRMALRGWLGLLDRVCAGNWGRASSKVLAPVVAGARADRGDVVCEAVFLGRSRVVSEEVSRANRHTALTQNHTMVRDNIGRSLLSQGGPEFRTEKCRSK